jgi:hypothetical protein
MKWRDLLAEWGATKLQLSPGFLDLEFAPTDAERRAAWDLYVELATRVSTQSIDDAEGADSAALGGLHALFGVTRGVLKQYGPGAHNFARVAIAVVNQVLRPFVTRWHARFDTKGQLPVAQRAAFRSELRDVQTQLTGDYVRVLAALAQVEDLETGE